MTDKEIEKDVGDMQKATSTSDEPSPKKRRMDNTEDEIESEANLLQKQAEILWKVKRDIKEYMTIADVDVILLSSGQVLTEDGITPEQKYDLLVDLIVFGVPEKCFKCKGSGIIMYNPSVHRYTCTGYITGYTRCTYQSKNPIRQKLKIPQFLMDNVFLRNHKFETLPKRYYDSGTDIVKSVYDFFEDVDEELPLSKAPIVKNGCSVDGDCEVAEVAHVYMNSKSELLSLYKP